MATEGRDQFRAFFAGLDLHSAKRIILDNRFNPGADSSNTHDVVSYVIDAPVEASMWRGLKHVPAYRSWGNEPEWEQSDPDIIQPRDGTGFLGPLVVLTGPSTFSSTEDVLVPLVASRRAVLAGSRTAGSTGNPIYVDLPGGGKFRVVSKRDLCRDGTEYVGYGIAPDVAVEPTRLNLVEGRDPVLEAGIEAIESRVLRHR
jgi:carboxyl-terminal processing protease